jgi:Transposase domain (DUF772)
MMVALLLYAYARGNRSSRAIERACVEDVAYRVVAGNLVPDHSTIAEFRVRHEAPPAAVFAGEVRPRLQGRLLVFPTGVSSIRPFLVGPLPRESGAGTWRAPLATGAG